MASLDWQCQRLDQLRPLTLHRILRARQEVFVVEQDCVYLDADAADEASWHLAAWAPDWQLMAYARIVDPGIKYAEPSMGRVVLDKALRGSGLADRLVAEGLARADAAWPGRGNRISAQAHLQRFYGRHGFASIGEPYLEDNIPHIEMWRQP